MVRSVTLFHIPPGSQPHRGQTATIPVKNPKPRKEEQYGGCRFVPIGSINVLGKDVRITGEIRRREPLTIEGEVGGTIAVAGHLLTIAPSGNVCASVEAKKIDMLGSLHGNVEGADKLYIRHGAQFVGDIHGRSIVNEDGLISGKVELSASPAALPDHSRIDACQLAGRVRKLVTRGLVIPLHRNEQYSMQDACLYPSRRRLDMCVRRGNQVRFPVRRDICRGDCC
jgi:cytoskeletal protein CcmA (bactofilin family)